jgi:2TM domain
MLEDRSDKAAYVRARKRVEELRGFYMHLGIYIAVILGLFLTNMMSSPRTLWFVWPALGWGVIVLFHGISLMFEGPFGQRWKERKTREYMERDRSRWGPRPPQPRAP